ncbi:MAG: hypothetical protein KUA43_10920 [Hoeflea sp.]|uniref:hypothetical protein n=1 Tax=Hoeflea sp. TaxID=1940281 RepID=UPI001D52B721|nr:hypothetical protein [Hoeflea sp.]MBU4529615.1 hypothetical protein [Alphaproteobacteria bacterium]MBU4546734.1 hypothetical protein [Alphaproteobacteria bacterium]MBU4551002.1 hypothetical protein [Alphaproteobacteria bacterium]MBV1723944.1 hypothetical protein [Hoeflea sp.]MBV1763221.1 hypothetical protein [Hoeflea sp.]
MKLYQAALMLCMPLALTGAAHATQSISCSDMKGDSGVDILLGAGPVPNVLAVTLALGERRLTTDPAGEGEIVTLAQAYDDGEVFRIDLMDDQATRRMAAIRLILADHDTRPLRIGTVQVEDEPPVGLSCEGP